MNNEQWIKLVIQQPHACEKQKAAWEKFEADYREFDIGMRDDLRNGYDAGYKEAAKSRDELIGKLLRGLEHSRLIFDDNMKFNTLIRPATDAALTTIKQALAEAQAQGYGE